MNMGKKSNLYPTRCSQFVKTIHIQAIKKVDDNRVAEESSPHELVQTLNLLLTNLVSYKVKSSFKHLQ